MNKTILSLLAALFALAITNNALACGGYGPPLTPFLIPFFTLLFLIFLPLLVLLLSLKFDRFKKYRTSCKYFWMGAGSYFLFVFTITAIGITIQKSMISDIEPKTIMEKAQRIGEKSIQFSDIGLFFYPSSAVFMVSSFLIYTLSLWVEKLKKHRQISKYCALASFLLACLFTVSMAMTVDYACGEAGGPATLDSFSTHPSASD